MSSMNYQIELVSYALKIMERRAAQEDRSVDSKVAYTSAIDMIYYALEENEEGLRQFDY